MITTKPVTSVPARASHDARSASGSHRSNARNAAPSVDPVEGHGDPNSAASAPPQQHRARERDRALLVGSIAYAFHGGFFLLLVIAALIRFGTIFGVLGAIIAFICLLSLKQAWTGFRRYRRG